MFKMIREIKELEEIVKVPKLHKLWEISAGNTKTLLKRFGNFCGWNKLVLEKDSDEVYRLELKPSYLRTKRNVLDKGIRKEFFFKSSIPSREYSGNQFCFIEYLQLIGKDETIPNKELFIKQGIEERIINLYTENAKKMFSL